MNGTRREPRWGWEPEPLRIELGLSEVMVDLDPRWEDWTGLEAVK